MTTKPKLGPCPWCGVEGHAEAYDNNMANRPSYVECGACLARGVPCWGVVDAIKAWNAQRADYERGKADGRRLERRAVLRAKPNTEQSHKQKCNPHGEWLSGWICGVNAYHSVIRARGRKGKKR